MIIDYIFIIFILICIYTDLRFRKVFNFVTLPAVILGLGLNFINFGFKGLLFSLLGLITGFLILFVFYSLGGFGAGDVKFMAVAGCLKGSKFVLIGGFYGILIGGIYVCMYLLFKKRFGYTVKKIVFTILLFLHLKDKEALIINDSQSLRIPYSVFLSSGMLLNLLLK
jgi:prepilin peptidase CpaA